MRFKNIYIIGNGVMGKLLTKRIEKFYLSHPLQKTYTFDKGDDVIIPDGEQGFGNLVIIATPISQIPSVLTKLSGQTLRNCFVVEIGSTKSNWEEYIQIASWVGCRFECYHPMVGPLADWDEKNWDANCLCVTHEQECHEETKEFWEDLGFKIRFVDLSKHDEIIGKLSHLSHYLIMQYVDFVNETTSEQERELAGTSFAKFSQMAEGARRLDDIYKTNYQMDSLITRFVNYLNGEK